MLCLLLVGLHCMARGQTEYAYRYWLDNASMTEHGGTSTDSIWTMELDVDSLGEGLHQLHVQVRDTAGLWSTPQSRFFLKATPVDATDLKVRYWFDDGLEITEMQGASGVHDIDVSALSWGLHSVNYQVAGSNGIYSPTSTAMFMKIRMGSEAYTARCYIGDSLYAEQKLPMEECVINWDLDVSDIPRGLHSLRMQVNTQDGTAVSVAHSFFWREQTAAEHNATRCVYTVDGGRTFHEAPAMNDNGYRFDVDISALKEGLHQLLCMIVDAENTVLHSCSRFFMVKHPTTMRYDYWVNNDTANLRTVVAQPMEPYVAMEMLAVPTYPLLPSSFHFEMEDAIPYIYAKNTLHARFYGTNGTYAKEYRMYADVKTRRKVVDALLLESGKPRTDATPDTDSIRWYRIEATAGKGLSFCVSQPCTVQLFSPEGARLLDLSGEAVTDTFACYAATSGSYYVALHSVTGTEAQTTISYLHGVVMYHQLTYLVDGEMYMSQAVATGDSIALLAAPVKDNRPFSGWMGAPEVMPEYDVTVRGAFEYRVSYVVLDSVLWNTGYYYGEEINDSPEPEKIWYLFDGWDGLPETMVARDISVTARFVFLYELGDVNGDDRISVSDITVLTNHIMKLPNTTFIRDAADLNGDGRISVVDVTMTTNKILSDEE